MKRIDFLQEMRKGFLETAKSVYSPFIQEDLEKIESATDRALGISWLRFTSENEASSRPELKFIDGKPFIMCFDGANMTAKSAICPDCSNLIILTALYSSGKCLNCEKEYNFITKTGDLDLLEFPVKKINTNFFIGVTKEHT